MNTYCLIMAGGNGSRFWPLSRSTAPKQLLCLDGNKTLIEQTLERITPICPLENIFIITAQCHSDKIREVLGSSFLDENILVEPVGRNTAACIGYAAMKILHQHGDGVLCVFPADHNIQNQSTFLSSMQTAITFAQESSGLITLGITPTYPATGYGYIHFEQSSNDIIKNVLEFREKPDSATAQKYIMKQDYLWNSGIFIWKLSVILEQIERFLPDLYQCLTNIISASSTENSQDILLQIYPRLPSVSIDYGVLENSKNMKVIPVDFGWSDIGSWEQLDTFTPPDTNGNICIGEHLSLDTNNCILYSKKRLVATLGVEDLIIVETDDAVLVCSRSETQNIRRLVTELEEKQMNKYL